MQFLYIFLNGMIETIRKECLIYELAANANSQRSNRQYEWKRNKAPFSWRQCLFTNELASETLPGQRTPDSGAEKV